MTNNEKTKSQFEEWFELQFGKDIDPTKIWELRGDLENTLVRVDSLRQRIAEKEKRMAILQAAMYAWNARSFCDQGIPLVKKEVKK